MDWDQIRLAVFDVDGTLYDQRRLRIRMAIELLRDALATRSLTTFKILKFYRTHREELGDSGTTDFEATLIAATADHVGLPPDKVRAIVGEWIERRPLRHLAACRYPGLPPLFAGLRRRGITIGIFSDYPAAAKLAALGLLADHIVYAGDPGIGVLKPSPIGLQRLMAEAGATPGATVMIGDRVERDGYAGRDAGTACLIRSSRPIAGWQTFAGYDDAIFAPVLA